MDLGFIGRKNKYGKTPQYVYPSCTIINSKRYIYVQWYVELVHMLLENFYDLDVSSLIKVEKIFSPN